MICNKCGSEINRGVAGSTHQEYNCFGKFSKDDCYCKECNVAVECYEKCNDISS